MAGCEDPKQRQLKPPLAALSLIQIEDVEAFWARQVTAKVFRTGRSSRGASHQTIGPASMVRRRNELDAGLQEWMQDRRVIDVLLV